MISLKVCPFCGQYPLIEDHDDNGWFIGCVNKECIAPSFWEYDKEEGVRIWNKRGGDDVS